MFSAKELVLNFGNPKNTNYEASNIITLDLPFDYIYSGNFKNIKIKCNKKVATNFIKAHELIWAEVRKIVKNTYGANETTKFYDDKSVDYLRKLRLNICGGSFNIRKMRTINAWSHHSFGIAIDIDPAKNPMSKKLTTSLPSWYVNCWKKAGFEWGGDWKNDKDSMHFEVARFI